MANELWKMMSQMINQGGDLLRNGLHAKALFYRDLRCADIF